MLRIDAQPNPAPFGHHALPAGQILDCRDATACTLRPDLDVAMRHLPPGGAVFLTSLIAGQSLGEAAALALDASPAFDIASSIAGMIEAGVFTAAALEKQDGH